MAGRLSMLQLIIIDLVGWLGWLSGIALAQLEFSEAVTGSAVGVTDVEIVCLLNVAVFFAIILRSRLYLDMGARDVMATITGPTDLKEIGDVHGDVHGLSTTKNSRDGVRHASVVMLSRDLSNPSIRLFMKYMCNTHDVYSILLKYVPLRTALQDSSISVEGCPGNAGHHCNCIVFSTKEEIIKKHLVTRIPGTLKQLNSLYHLLPCSKCRSSGCHQCDRELLCFDGNNNLHDCAPATESFAVCEALDLMYFPYSFDSFEQDNEGEPICICIPPMLHKDRWTKVLVKSLMSKDVEDRGAIDKASVALEKYLSLRGEIKETVEYYRTRTFILPRLIEIVINFSLTAILKLDGFSSALVARRTVRKHIVDSTGNAFAASAFLTAVLVKSDASNSDDRTVCQILRFRGSPTLLTLKTLSFTVGLVNLFCTLYWGISIGLGGRAPKWYQALSEPPSMARLAVVMAAICIGLVMDCFDLQCSKDIGRKRQRGILVVAMSLEIMCIVAGTAVALTLGIKGFGRWVYSALQFLVWVKWGVGCYLLGEFSPEYVRTSLDTDNYKYGWWGDVGTMVYSSSFLLNAVFAGVRGWK